MGKKKMIIFGSVALIVVVAVLVGWLEWRHHRANQTAAEKTAYQNMLSDSRNLISAQEYTLAEQSVQRYLATKPAATKPRTRAAYMQLANAYGSANDFANSVHWYQQAMKLDASPQLDAVVGIAYAYQAQGDKANAIKYFQQAITLTQKSDSASKASDIQTFQYLIQQMGGQA